jgi:dTDP-glucose 4,6-dehydratase
MMGVVMRLLVTGGAGFIGSNFVRKVVSGLFPNISKLRVLDKLTYAGNLDNFSLSERNSFDFMHGDICDQETVKLALSGIDAVVNFAAESHVDRSIKSASKFIETNIQGTQMLLDCTRLLEVENYVQVSTDEVYGSINGGSWKESDPLLPNSPYAASKASADLLVRASYQTHGLNVKITRCTNNYGPNQFPEKIIPLFITNIIEGGKVPVYGKGRNIRDWLHVDDHCSAIYLVLTAGRAGEIYNVGGGRELTNLQLTSKILDLMGRSNLDIEFVKDRIGHDQRYSVDFTKIRSELGYSPQVNFDEGLVKTVNWYQTHETWWKPLKSKK